jgi:AcrR family transcriptional regulator
MPTAVGGERRRSRGQLPKEIIQAARQNFQRYGVNRTTMSDVARDVGMSRQAMYEYVCSRSDLVDAVLLQRIREIAEDLKPLSSEGISFTDAFIDTSVAAIDTARSDEELMNIFTTGPNDRIQDVVTGPFQEVHEIVVNLLGPILQRGLRAGELRTDKTQSEMIDWIRAVYLILISQGATENHSVREMIADFLLPSIMFSRNASRRPRRPRQDEFDRGAGSRQ